MFPCLKFKLKAYSDVKKGTLLNHFVFFQHLNGKRQTIIRWLSPVCFQKKQRLIFAQGLTTGKQALSILLNYLTATNKCNKSFSGRQIIFSLNINEANTRRCSISILA